MVEVSHRLSYYRAKLLGYLWFDGPLPASCQDLAIFRLPMPQAQAHLDTIRQIAMLLQDLGEEQLRQASAMLPTPRYVRELRQTGQPTSPAAVFEHEAMAQAHQVIQSLQAIKTGAPPTDRPSDH